LIGEIGCERHAALAGADYNRVVGLHDFFFKNSECAWGAVRRIGDRILFSPPLPKPDRLGD
jgi:hypothetical protein